MDIRIGFGVDVHRLSKSRDLILGGVKIDSEFGAIGHSDADVLTHAVIDSILGALNLGDIGQHFPDTDEEYKDIFSLELLKKVVVLMEAEGYEVSNLDSVVILESPKLVPYKAKIATNLAEVLQVDSSRISIKAKTNESLGYLGKNEGIKAYCNILLKK